MFTTPLSDQLGIRVPIWNAGMGGGLAGVELAAAVSGAGGLGVLGMGGLPTGATRDFIQQLKARTDAPYGVNLIMPLLDEGQVECCIDEQVPVLILFWGDAGPYVEKAHAAGTKGRRTGRFGRRGEGRCGGWCRRGDGSRRRGRRTQRQ